jgi:micrococcal nuclease
MTTPDYRYAAKILRIIDADTIEVDLDLGCDIHTNLTLRLYGINAPEMRTAEGKAAKAYVQIMLPVDTPVVIETIKDRREKYGRYLAIVWHEFFGNANQHLLDNGYAVPMDERGRSA